MMEYILYKTTNTINDKFYIGVHKRNGRNYLGSGKILKSAIKKYGKENFRRETLISFKNESDAYDFEKMFVNEKMIMGGMCYNIVEGGGNPPTFYGEDNPMHRNNISISTRMKMSASAKIRPSCSEETRKKRMGVEPWNKGLVGCYSEETRRKMSASQKRRPPCSEETRQKMRESLKNKPKKNKWFIMGKEFNGCLEASHYFGVKFQTISKWCKNPNKPDCYKEKLIYQSSIV